MVNFVPGLTPSAAGLSYSQLSPAAPETLPTNIDQQTFNEFVLQLRSELTRLEGSLALPPGSDQSSSDQTSSGDWNMASGLLGLGDPTGLAGQNSLPGFDALSAGGGLPAMSGMSGFSGLPGGSGFDALSSSASLPAMSGMSGFPGLLGGSGLAALTANPFAANLQSLAPSAAGGKIAQAATHFLGSPYVWGGQSPTGFDCTGFTWYAAKQAGINLPLHDLAGQMAAGQHVDQSNLQPGDLVFFQNTYQPGLSHVGIALGGGRFIHAASETQGVIVSRLDEPYYAQRYVGATRVAGTGAPNPYATPGPWSLSPNSSGGLLA